MPEFNWQQQPPERAGIYTCDGYEVRWKFQGGTGLKVWQAKSPMGAIADFHSKEKAIGFCEVAIKRRRDIAESSRREESSELAELKSKGKAQIETMREMLK